MLSNLYSNKETAKLLGCSPNSLKQSRVSGMLFGAKAPSYIKLGRSVRYEQNTIAEWRDQFPEIDNTGWLPHE